MNIKINHFSLGARNIYESAARLYKETNFGFWTGEWVGTTACHMFPLGNDQFIEVEGTIDAHAYLKMPKSTLYRMVQQKELPGHKIGRTWRFDREEIDKWIKSGERSRSDVKK